MSFSKELRVEISKVVARLQTVDEFAWRRFMELMAQRVDEATGEMVAAAGTDVYVAQGRAQEIREIFRTFDEGMKFAKQLHEKETNNGKRTPYPLAKGL